MPNSHYYGLIMAGGRGTRFWPRSRRASAKQVLRFFGRQTLIQQTVGRLAPLIPPERIWVITNKHLRAEIVRQLPEVPKQQIIAEPAARNTAPCIALAAHILESVDPEAVMGVFPADHIIQKPSRFLRLLRPAFRAAADGGMLVLGIQPRWPETGYGYIEFPPGVKPGSLEPVAIRGFREKPDQETANRFLSRGCFAWNAGMFFWRASVFLRALRRHLPATAALLDSLPPFGAKGFASALDRTFPQCENISVDYALLEKADNVMGLASDDIGWNDVGSWNAVYELYKPDAAGNVTLSPALVEASAGNFVDAPGKLVALLGVHDLVVVDTADALLVADRSRCQEVSTLVRRLEKQKRDDLL